MKKLFAIVFLISFFYSQSQTSRRLDSLKNISKEQIGLPLIKTLNEISWEFRNFQVDSALFYAKHALDVAESENSEKAIASAYNNIASSFEAGSHLDSAVIYHQKSLKIKLKVGDSIGIADTYNNLGIVEDIKGNYDLALKNYFKALKIYEKHSKDFEKVPTVLVNIGIVYKKQKEFQKVFEYYQRALAIYKENNFEIGETIVTGNIGSVLINLQEYQKSIQYSERAKHLYAKLGYTRYVPYMQENIGIAKDSLKQYESARKEYLSAISSFKKDQNLYELSSTKISLANNYTLSKEFFPARKELLEALEIINKNGFKEMRVKAFQSLASVDALTNDFKNAYINHKQYVIAKDSLFEAEKVKTIYELETKYETERKEKEILAQRANIAEKELHINQKNTQLVGLVVLVTVLSLLGYLLYNQQKLKNHQLKKESELKEALIKIETQNKLQEQRIRISRDLHDNIGAQLTFIISSIENLQYGFKITNEKLTNKLTSISQFTKETIYELRDTIWALNKNEISLEDLQARISNLIDKANSVSTKVDLEFNMHSRGSENPVFTSVKGMNIYRIIQEAINNAIKYAEATKILVVLKKIDNHVGFSIIDNGKGFDEANIVLGNGINNMKKRALDINAVLNINSEVSKGTSIELKV
jgi:signal transduction histidine kinase